jgi:hypothetical protein
LVELQSKPSKDKLKAPQRLASDSSRNGETMFERESVDNLVMFSGFASKKEVANKISKREPISMNEISEAAIQNECTMILDKNNNS